MLFRPSLLARRRFLQALAGTITFPCLRQLMWASDPPDRSPNQPTNPANYPFLEIPSSASGITWTHTAGSSSEKYLPESTGAGCAFFDYDNDGWMDIYLVNSGPCDFYDPRPALRNALYKNNRDGTFTDVTEKAGLQGGGY